MKEVRKGKEESEERKDRRKIKKMKYGEGLRSIEGEGQGVRAQIVILPRKG